MAPGSSSVCPRCGYINVTDNTYTAPSAYTYSNCTGMDWGEPYSPEAERKRWRDFLASLIPVAWWRKTICRTPRALLASVLICAPVKRPSGHGCKRKAATPCWQRSVKRAVRQLMTA